MIVSFIKIDRHVRPRDATLVKSAILRYKAALRAVCATVAYQAPESRSTAPNFAQLHLA